MQSEPIVKGFNYRFDTWRLIDFFPSVFNITDSYYLFEKVSTSAVPEQVMISETALKLVLFTIN